LLKRRAIGRGGRFDFQDHLICNENVGFEAVTDRYGLAAHRDCDLLLEPKAGLVPFVAQPSLVTASSRRGSMCPCASITGPTAGSMSAPAIHTAPTPMALRGSCSSSVLKNKRANIAAGAPIPGSRSMVPRESGRWHHLEAPATVRATGAYLRHSDTASARASSPATTCQNRSGARSYSVSGRRVGGGA
jgi:hypothetical protein